INSYVIHYFINSIIYFFFFQAEDGIRDRNVTGVQTCALPICLFFMSLWIFFHCNSTNWTDFCTFSTSNTSMSVYFGNIIRSSNWLNRCKSAGSLQCLAAASTAITRSEEHTSELQSRFDLVCRLL